MSTEIPATARLPSEDVIISAPMSYSGSAQRIIRLRRRARTSRQLVAITAASVLLILIVWVLVTVWYVMWSFLLVPYRLMRRGARRHKVEALRHRELLAAIQGAAAAKPSQPPPPPGELVADSDREYVIAVLREHLLAGRLTVEEFEERFASAQRARTHADLGAATASLPSNGRVLR